MREIRFAVWQFVRLMVQLEDTVKTATGAPLKDLYDGWEDIWVDLDARLVDLGKHDHDAFADLMMDQEVICDDLSAEECGLVADVLETVQEKIKAALRETEDEQEVEDLSFERDELTVLIREARHLSKQD